MDILWAMLMLLFLSEVPDNNQLSLDYEPFKDIYQTASFMYKLGQSNNFIAMDVLKIEGLEMLKTSPEPITKAYSYDFIKEQEESLMSSIEECIFMEQSSYKNHLSLRLKKIISKEFALFLSPIVQKYHMWVFKMEGEFLAQKMENVSSPCALVVYYQGRYLLMQASYRFVL